MHKVFQREFLISILIPIPKGATLNVDLSNSYNYCPVSGKLLDNIIIGNQREALKTSTLQFGYNKPK